MKKIKIRKKLKINIKNLKSLEMKVAIIVNKIYFLKKWNFKCEQKTTDLIFFKKWKINV